VLLSTATDLWALRYPEPNELYVLDRRKAPSNRRFHLRTNRIRADSDHLRSRPSVVFASERMDDDPRWRLLEPGELVHVDSALQINSEVVLPDPPRHQLGPADLNATAQATQQPSST
jgi:predicted glutamine amidotransferase